MGLQDCVLQPSEDFSRIRSQHPPHGREAVLKLLEVSLLLFGCDTQRSAQLNVLD